MAATINSSGAQACTVGTEHTLVTITTPGTYHLGLTIPAAATPADIYEVTPLTKLAASGDTAARGETVSFRGTGAVFTAHPLPPLLGAISTAFLLKQIAGTGRTVAWAVEAV